MPNYILGSASIGTISGGTFINQSEKLALDKLSAAAAPSALHDAPARTDESRCHQHTRTNVLNNLERWAQGICDEGACIFWLYGGAGAGKSAVMQSLAERCVAQGLVLATFFFSRTDAARNTAEVLIPTLVYQIVQSFPAALQSLNPIIDGDPLIFKKSFRVQLLTLFVRPVQYLVQLGLISDAPNSPRVFLIDGLDECDDPAQQQSIIQAVAAVCHEHRIPVKFLIASRPELAISASFRRYEQSNRILGNISLSEDANAAADIRRYIEAECMKIRSLHPFNQMIPSDWPSLYDINRLVWKSSSHFIYASTALKYIWSAKENPVRSLQIVLGLEVSRTGLSPFPELDALYHHILRSAAHLDKVLQILAHCMLSALSSAASVVCIMLDCSKDDLFVYMADMTPLVVFSKREFSHEEEAKLLHASLEDFLCDQSRSGSLYLDKEVYLASKLKRCFYLLNLYSRKQRTRPDWPVDPSLNLAYSSLTEQVIYTIEMSGHLFATQEVLRQYGLRNFHECHLRMRHVDQEMPHIIGSISRVLLEVHKIKTSDGVRLFESFLEEFFEILESDTSLESTPLAPAILPLIFAGYPPQAVREILEYHFMFKLSHRLIAERFISDDDLDFMTNLSALTMSELGAIGHSVIVSPKRAAVAAEAVLGYLFDEVKTHRSSTYPAHRSWLQWTKPGKHVATGSPRLASVMHTRCLSLLSLLEDPDYTRRRELHGTLRSLSMVLGLQSCLSPHWLGRRQDTAKMVVTLLKALLWVLPKASFSEKIILYSKRVFPRDIFQREAGLVRRVRNCLDKYNIRVRDAKLQSLGRRIENGDVDALIEKSRIFYLDAQD